DPADMRARKTVSRQVPVLALKPCGSYIYTGRRQLDHLAVSKTELMRIGLFAFNYRDQRRREHRRKAGLGQIIRRRHDNTAGQVCTVEKIVERRKKLRFRRA